MSSFKHCYDEQTYEVFNRASNFCKRKDFKVIETLFVVREFLKEGDSELYEFFQNMDISEDDIKKSFDVCVEELKSDAEETEVVGQAITITCINGEECEVLVSKQLAKVINNMNDGEEKELKRFRKEHLEDVPKEQVLEIVIDQDTFIMHIIEEMPNDMANFLRRLGLMVSEVQYEFCFCEWEMLDEYEDITTASGKREASEEIPKQMNGFLKDLTAEYRKGARTLILGRDKETKSLWNIISKMNKRNAVLVGEPGVGKTAIVQKIAQDIKNGICPEKFKHFRIISLDISGLIAGTEYRGEAEERFNLLNTFLEENKDVILFIDEIHTMLGAGSCKEGEMDLANSMKPILAGNKAIVIGATTTHEYEKYFSRDGALKRRFERIDVKEPKTEDIYSMLKNKIKALQKFHGVTVSKGMVDFIIFTASCFDSETRNPDRTLDLLDRSMVVAKVNGKSAVDRDSVLENYEINFEKFNKMSLEEKRATAYHEAGHFVVHEMSGRLTNTKTVAISIMPSEYFLGVNVFEETDETVNATMKYYIDSLASHLAGREAERLISSEDNSGADNDLQKATREAYEIVTKFGMIEGYNIAYLHDDEVNLLSEESRNMISKSVKKIINEAEKRALEILTQNRDLLDVVAKELLKKKMLSRKDLDRILLKVSSKQRSS